MSSPTLIALDCPKCGSPLPGLEADLAFACTGCGRAWEVQAGRFVPRPFRQIRAPQRRGMVRINLPVWQFPAEVSASASGNSNYPVAGERVSERGRQLDAGYALACTIPRSDVFGDWAHRWTGMQPAWDEDSVRRPVVGATLSSADAAALAEHYLLDLLDRIVDLAGITGFVDLGEPTLLAVPAYDEATTLHSLCGKLTIRARALNDYLEMLEETAFREDRG